MWIKPFKLETLFAKYSFSSIFQILYNLNSVNTKKCYVKVTNFYKIVIAEISKYFGYRKSLCDFKLL